MKPKREPNRETPSSKERWEAGRARYTWYLRPPFKNILDRSHWWNDKSDSEIDPAGALYELARRHPAVGEEWRRRMARRDPRALQDDGGVNITAEWLMRAPSDDTKASPPSLYSTCLCGLYSWASLTYTDQENWKFDAGCIKGMDFRMDDEKCWLIKLLAHWSIIDKRKEALRKRERTSDERGPIPLKDLPKLIANYDEWHRRVRQHMAQRPPTAKEWETAIARRAVEAHRRGDVLLAIAPDLKAKEAACLMERCYREHLKHYPPPEPRQRAKLKNSKKKPSSPKSWQRWLSLIESFEDAETNPKARLKSDVFRRYRGVLDSLRFT